jgi:hypothetical protein
MSTEAEFRKDTRMLDERDRKRINMTRDERVAEAAKQRKLAENISAFALREERDLTEREAESVRSAINLASSIEHGLLNEMS